jgi:hypothetical protein
MEIDPIRARSVVDLEGRSPVDVGSVAAGTVMYGPECYVGAALYGLPFGDLWRV